MSEENFYTKIFPSLIEILSIGTNVVNGNVTTLDTSHFNELKVHIMGSTTTDMLARAIGVGCLQEKILPHITQSLYGSYIQDVLNPSSELYAIKPDIIVISSDLDSLVTDLPANSSQEDVNLIIDKKANQILSLWNRITKDCGSKIIHHFPPPPFYRVSGIAEQYLPASYQNQLKQLLKRLWESEKVGVQIIDFGQFALENGLLKSFAPRSWYSAKLPIENNVLPIYVPLFRSALRSVTNAAKKVLVLDLDNTLWGGVIGDDGVEGIKIGSGDAVSEAFAAFQKYVKLLANRGVILAVCSKNNPEIAKMGFDKEGSILQVNDFAVFEASWNDKASGLRKIAKQLNVGLDSFVFVDDNPVECNLIRQELPEVAVVNVIDDPADFIYQVEQGYWFQFQKYSNDDFARTEAYASRAAALLEQEEALDLTSYLKSLNMIGSVQRPTEEQIERFVQLGQKTNQFNLLTQRFDEQTVRRFLSKEDNIIIASSLKDKFGDHGLVSTFIAEKNEDNLNIVEWTMSCRVFSRTFEEYIMNAVLEEAKQKNIKTIIGKYSPTKKNAVVADLYDRLGFKKIDEQTWIIHIKEIQNKLETLIN